MLTWLLSNRYRLLKMGGVLLIAAIFIYWGIDTGFKKETTFIEALSSPVDFYGQEFYFSGKIIDIDQQFVVVRDRGMYIDLDAELVPGLQELSINNVVSGVGFFTEDQRIQVQDYHYHRFHYIKVWISLSVSIVMFIWFLRKFKIDIRHLVFVER